MKNSLQIGLGFGLTSAAITTLGLIVGLDAGTNSRLVVLAGIFTIAIADAFSDSLGIHVSQEAEHEKSRKEVWRATFATFFAKLLFALTFAVPFLFLGPSTATVASAIWGLSLIGLFSYYIAKRNRDKPWKVVGEHVFIALVVIIAAHYVGHAIALVFG